MQVHRFHVAQAASMEPPPIGGGNVTDIKGFHLDKLGLQWSRLQSEAVMAVTWRKDDHGGNRFNGAASNRRR